MEQKKIDRISELTRLSRARALTPEEEAERESLRREYRAAVRQSLEAQIESIRVVDDKGNESKLKKKR